MRLQPQFTGCWGGVHAGGFPPPRFVTAAVNLTMVAAAERHRELIAHLPAQRTSLGKAQMMRIGRTAAANQARLLRHESDVLPVTNAPRLGEGEHSFIDSGRGNPSRSGPS